MIEVRELPYARKTFQAQIRYSLLNFRNFEFVRIGSIDSFPFSSFHLWSFDFEHLSLKDEFPILCLVIHSKCVLHSLFSVFHVLYFVFILLWKSCTIFFYMACCCSSSSYFSFESQKFAFSFDLSFCLPNQTLSGTPVHLSSFFQSVSFLFFAVQSRFLPVWDKYATYWWSCLNSSRWNLRNNRE